MNKIELNKRIVSVLCGLGMCFTLGSVNGDVADPAAPVVAPLQLDSCSKELLTSYFPEAFVNNTLKSNDVPKDQWDAINKELSVKDKAIIKTVEEKAAKMTPNPLNDPQQRQVAVKIFRETLFDSFAQVMRAHGIKDDQKIQAMLDDIQQQKAKRFGECMENQKKESAPVVQRPAAPAAVPAASVAAPATMPAAPSDSAK